MNVTYGCAPGVFVTPESDLELPDDDRLWNAHSAEQWQQYVRFSTYPQSRKSLELLGKLMYGKDLDTSFGYNWDLSPFTASIAMHLVNVQVWHLMQASQSFNCFSVNAATRTSFQDTIQDQTEAALSRCYRMIMLERADGEHTWAETEGPLLFNCLAVLRISYITAFTGIAKFNRLVLLSDSLNEISNAIAVYVAQKESRGPLITGAITRAFEGLLIPMKAGPSLIRKTAALSWSIEHAIAFWDCG